MNDKFLLAKTMLSVYVLVRLMPYLLQGRQYEWWHALFDVFVVAFVIGFNIALVRSRK